MKKLSILVFAMIVSVMAHGQKKAPENATVLKMDQNVIANTPAKSGLSYEALTQFFQANLSTGASGGYDFKATLFAIKKFFSKDSLNASAVYLAQYYPRNLELGLGLHKGNNSSNYSLLTGSFKLAIINNLDKSTVNFAAEDNGALGRDIDLITGAEFNAFQQYNASIAGDETKKKELAAATEKFKKSGDIKDYPQAMQDIYNKELLANGKDPASFSLKDEYDRIGKLIDKRGLLTLSFTPAYDYNLSRFDSTGVNLEYLIGFGNYKKPWNIDLQGSAVFLHDSTSKKRDLGRSMYILKAGINKVLAYDSKLNPLIELELAYEDDYIGNGLYKKENQNQPKIVNILRVHITKEITLPLTLKYDLKHPNLFGIFSFQWNLEGGKKG
jgi:hypothetical protein